MPIEQRGGIRIGNSVLGKPTAGALPFGGGVDFDRDAFIIAIRDKGYDVKWERASFCPNRVMATGYGGLAPRDHRISCTICDGSGFIFFSCEPTRMLMTSMTLSENHYAYGRWDAGTQLVTAEERLHPRDRLTLLTGIARFHELVRRSDSLRDRLKYPALCVEDLSWIDRTGTLRHSVENVNFVLSTEGYIDWLSASSRPDPDVYYSIAYTYRPRYVVTELMHQHRESTIDGVHYEFPVHAAAKLDFLMHDEATDAAETNDQSPFPSTR